VEEFVEYLKARPGKLDYASTSNATALPVELFKKMTATDIRHIPFKGAGQVTNALLGGEVQISMPGAVAVLAHVRSGRLRALGIGDLKRSALLPDVPTIAESGVPGYQAAIWSGMVAPAKTPQSIVGLLNTEILRVLAKPEFKERVGLLGADVVGSSPEQWENFLLSEIRKWAEIAKISRFHSE
jgi:tripartite-type tricarboxylate transporter receptor subunit TctC